MTELRRVHAGAEVAHREQRALLALGAQRDARRLAGVGAMAQRVVQQVAYQHAHAGAVERLRRQIGGQIEHGARAIGMLGSHLAKDLLTSRMAAS